MWAYGECLFLVVLHLTRMTASSVTSCPTACWCHPSEDDVSAISVICTSLGLSDIPTNLPSDSLDSLDLSTNGIALLENDSFLHTPKLSTLYLSYNEITNIQVNAFAILRNLRELDLSNNELTYLDPDTFSNNPRLEALFLSRNALAHVPPDLPFLISSTIQTLDLSFCSLNSLYPSTFSKLPRLEILDLSSNHLQTLSLDTLTDLQDLTIVELGNNRWICSCELQNLMQWVNSLREDIPDHKPVKCRERGKFKTLWTRASGEKLCNTTATDIPKFLKSGEIQEAAVQEPDSLYSEEFEDDLRKEIEYSEENIKYEYNHIYSETPSTKIMSLKSSGTQSNAHNDANTDMLQIGSILGAGQPHSQSVSENLLTWNKTTMLLYVVFPCTLAISVLVTLVGVNFIIRRMDSRLPLYGELNYSCSEAGKSSGHILYKTKVPIEPNHIYEEVH